MGPVFFTYLPWGMGVGSTCVRSSLLGTLQNPTEGVGEVPRREKRHLNFILVSYFEQTRSKRAKGACL